MKIIAIADIHGRSNWKFIADINKLLKQEDIIPEFDKYIFLGDYVDSFTETGAIIIHNLKEIIQFKQKYPNNIILLLGNHDLQYYFQPSGHGCSGFRPNMYQELHKIFQDNKDLFTPSYEIQNYLFTHAGVTSVWLKKYTKELGLSNNHGYTPSYIIHEGFKIEDETLFDVGWARGGSFKSGGPFWADKSESSTYALPNHHQIVGHHPVENSPYVHKVDDNTSITYVDNNNTGFVELEIKEDMNVKIDPNPNLRGIVVPSEIS